MEIDSPKCPSCNAEVTEAAFFCSSCGKPLKARPQSTSIGRQIVVYLVSFFLAPFGLAFAWKYLKMPDKKSKYIGLVSIVLTVAAVIMVFLTAKTFLETTYDNIRVINSLLY